MMRCFSCNAREKSVINPPGSLCTPPWIHAEMVYTMLSPVLQLSRVVRGGGGVVIQKAMEQ